MIIEDLIITNSEPCNEMNMYRVRVSFWVSDMEEVSALVKILTDETIEQLIEED